MRGDEMTPTDPAITAEPRYQVYWDVATFSAGYEPDGTPESVRMVVGRWLTETEASELVEDLNRVMRKHAS